MLKKITLATLVLTTSFSFSGPFRQVVSIAAKTANRPRSIVLQLATQQEQCYNTTPLCSYQGQCLCAKLRSQMHPHEITAAMRLLKKWDKKE